VNRSWIAFLFFIPVMQLDSRLRGNDELRRALIPTARHTVNAIDCGSTLAG